MLDVLNNLIDKLFALPGFILAVIELKKFLSDSSEDQSFPNLTTEAYTHERTTPRHSNVDAENRKTVFAVYYYLSLFLSIGISIFYVYHNRASIPIIKITSYTIGNLNIIISYLLFGLYQISRFFIYILIGASTVALVTFITNRHIKSIIKTCIFLSFFMCAFIMGISAFPSDLKPIYDASISSTGNSYHNMLTSMVPYVLAVEPFILLASIHQISAMLYLKKSDSPYLKDRLRATFSLWVIPVLLILSTLYWAFLL